MSSVTVEALKQTDMLRLSISFVCLSALSVAEDINKLAATWDGRRLTFSHQ